MKAYKVKEEHILELPKNRNDSISQGERINARRRIDYYREQNAGTEPPYDYGVHLVCGPRRAGKSTLAGAMAMIYHQYGRNVVSNIGLLFGHRVDVMDLYLMATRAPPDTVIVIDEIHALLSRYAQNALKARMLIEALAGVGKKGLTVIGISQQEHNVSMDFKAECDWIHYPSRRIPHRGDAGRSVYPPWAWLKDEVIGPHPVRGKSIGEQYGIDVYGPPPSKETRRLNPALIYEAAKLQYTFDDVPFGEQAGLFVSAKDVRQGISDDDTVLDFGESEDGDAELEQQQSQEARMLLYGRLAASVLLAYHNRGETLWDSSFETSFITGEVNSFYGKYLEELGQAFFSIDEGNRIMRALFNARSNRVRRDYIVLRHPELQEIYQPPTNDSEGDDEPTTD